MSAGWAIEIAPLDDAAGLEAQWRALEEDSEATFFLSWSWIGTWLNSLKAAPLLLRLRREGGNAGLALLAPCKTRRHGLVLSRQWHLHASGDADLDRIAIEYNGILLRRGLGPNDLAGLFQFLRQQGGWDEFVLPGVAPSYAEAGRAAGLGCVIDHAARAFVIDLGRLRNEQSDLMQRISANGRTQLRQSLRMAEAQGALTLTPAASPSQAQEFLSRLMELDRHGGNGAFATPTRQEFHRRLIEAALPRGEVEILEGRAGENVLGYLYHFLYRGRVMAYQAAFRPGPDNRHRPGLVMHHLAIERAARAGHLVYDFLAGEARYKRSLGSADASLLWCRLQQPRLRFALEGGARRLRAALF